VKLPLRHLAVLAVFFSFPWVGSAAPLSLATAETLLVTQNYSAAEKCIAEFLQAAPDDCRALYLRVAIEQTELLDYESYYLHGERFLKAADSVRKVLEGRLQTLRGTDSLQCLFYIANIIGGMGVIKAKLGRWFPAIKNSLTSVKLLKEAVERDSGMYAAMLGIGAFHYYLRKSFSWLPFIDANSGNKGVREIEKAISAPYLFRFAAENTLCWILIDQEQFDRADSVACSALAETPGSTIFLRIRCLIALWSAQYTRAVELGQKLSEVSLMRDPVNWSDYVMAYYVLTGGYQGLGKIKEALASARHILGATIPPEFREIPSVKKNLKRIVEIKEKCLE
jgi:tetratricopeptide (TPR) repeat protein